MDPDALGFHHKVRVGIDWALWTKDASKMTESNNVLGVKVNGRLVVGGRNTAYLSLGSCA